MKGKLKTWTPILPGTEELKENSRSRSARLRYFHKNVNSLAT